MTYYVDVHAHLTHPEFNIDCNNVIKKAEEVGLKVIIVNGLEPKSNRQTLNMAKNHHIIQPALGIYPVNAVCDQLADNFPLPVEKFDLVAELSFIREQAMKQHIVAIGECGLDGHWLGPETWAKQEFVFEKLIEIAMDANLPVIIHSRKLEKRVIEILTVCGTKKVNFHCFGGKSKLALQVAEKFGWSFSIPAIAHKNHGFSKLLKYLPPECILTETDCPYLSPIKNTRNEPSNVLHTVALLASIRDWTLNQAKETIWHNFQRLFNF